MELDEIERIVDELDKRIPRESARVSLQKYGDESDEAFIVATERGYLRLGVEFLKAGFAPHVPAEKNLGERPHEIYVDIDYLLTEDSDVHFNYFERREDLTVKTHEDSWVDRAVILGVLSAIVAVFVLAVVGLVAVVKALF
jgi:hypothetical protein